MFDFLKKKTHLPVLVNEIPYVKSNCYIHQLIQTLEKSFKVELVEINNISKSQKRILQSEVVLSVLKLRSYRQAVPNLMKALGNHPVIVYEQDPWENFTDQGHCKGIYEHIFKNLNVRKFLLTSSWWAGYIETLKMPSAFVRIGTLPQYCHSKPNYEARSIPLGFQGSLHPYRKRLFDELLKKDIHVKVLKSADYFSYLKKMRDVQIFVYSEQANMTIEGKPVPYSVSWTKAIEVAAQGAFVVRDFEPYGYEGYGIGELPSIYTFKSFEEAASQIQEIQSMNSQKRQKMINSTVERIRSRDDWRMVGNEIRQFLGSNSAVGK